MEIIVDFLSNCIEHNIYKKNEIITMNTFSCWRSEEIVYQFLKLVPQNCTSSNTQHILKDAFCKQNNLLQLIGHAYCIVKMVFHVKYVFDMQQ